MKKLLLLFVLASIHAFAQDVKSVQTEIKEVTVFFQGAEVSRSGSVSIPAGIVTLSLDALSPSLDEKSIQFTANADVTVLATNFKVDFEAQEAAQKQKIAELNKQLKTLGEEVKTKRDLLTVSIQENQLVLDNAEYDKLEGITVAQLEQAINFAKNRMISIRQTQQKLRADIDDLNLARQKIVNQLQEVRIANAKPQGQVLVKLSSSRAQSLSFELSYTIAEASWRPYYDIKVKDISQPLTLDYKAKISQSSGEDWKQVKLKLSTGNPAEAALLADLNPWFLNFVNSNYRGYTPPAKPVAQQGFTGTFKGLVVDSKTSAAIPFANVVALNAQGNYIAGTTTDENGSFSMEVNTAAQRLEISFIGYNKGTQYLNEQAQFYNIKLGEASEQLEAVVVQYERPVTEKPIVTTDINGNTRIRGARDEGTVYFIDGVKVRGNTNIPQASIAQTKINFERRNNSSSGLPDDYFGRSESSQEFKISQNPVNLNFEVALPYDIPSNGEEYQVQVQSYEVPAMYSYTATPKLNENAFLTASLLDWERLNLLDGSAGLYLEGTYLGETEINVSGASDTLSLSLGKDENIKVLREAVKTEEGSSFLGGKRTKRYHYRISVRNVKAVPLKLTVIDQYPVSGNSDIKVERIEKSGAQLKEETGILTWELELQPKEAKKLDLIYEVSYPKGRRVNL